ncbi:hypothetical protein Tdes44962_MAKER04840 [Teratosphaeria destructans]|uniref:Mtf2-like C-terminal domain-containing protein n=1 Tax=Teratosphaeria destructans TaxID=418781 RepID=A0A9W7SLG6_9PEZI|nr:hypothetical protein Tdes44962_MAKER04840 [Teratosphaeria destructans]
MLARASRGGTATRCSDAWGSSTLLPFLYQTHTIQRRHFQPTTAHHDGHEQADGDPNQSTSSPTSSFRIVPVNTSSFRMVAASSGTRSPHTSPRPPTRPPSSRRERDRADAAEDHRGRPRHPSTDHVPFDRSGSAGSIGAPKTTITPGEKRVFEKLFTLKKDKPRRSKPGEQKDDDDDDDDESVESILESAVSRIHAQERPAKEFPAALKPMADEARARRERQSADAKEANRTAAIQRELDATNALLDAATSDVELLRALETHVLGRVVALNLEGTPKSEYERDVFRLHIRHRRKIRRQKVLARTSGFVNDRTGMLTVANQDDLEIMTVNFPDHLLHYMTISPEKFPGSLLSLNLLALLKRLGPAAFALGATTQLYNAHLRLLYSKFPFDLYAVVEVLEEMDRAVYPFDDDTEALLVEILRDAKKYVQRREGGPALEVMWRGAKMTRALQRVLEWRDEMGKRREEAALKRVREEETMREVALEVGALSPV